MRTKILGCFVDNLSMRETLDRVEELIKSGRPHQHVVVNVDKVVKANRNPALMDIINNCDLINADGMPVVWASRLLGRPLKERVAGIDLFVELLKRASDRGWSVFFLGAREHIVSKVIEITRARFPSIKIAGCRNGYWSQEEEAGVVQQIRNAKPDILFVAISSPRKEQFMEKYLEQMGVPFAMGVGGSFDVLADLTSRAPVWMQKAGLEWFYRFLQEPRRMFRRYFVDDMLFFWLLAKAMARLV